MAHFRRKIYSSWITEFHGIHWLICGSYPLQLKSLRQDLSNCGNSNVGVTISMSDCNNRGSPWEPLFIPPLSRRQDSEIECKIYEVGVLVYCVGYCSICRVKSTPNLRTVEHKVARVFWRWLNLCIIGTPLVSLVFVTPLVLILILFTKKSPLPPSLSLFVCNFNPKPESYWHVSSNAFSVLWQHELYSDMRWYLLSTNTRASDMLAYRCM